MSETTDAPQEAAAVAPARKPAAERKPRFALFIATACGLGYLPVAPGTCGSLVGVALYAILARPLSITRMISISDGGATFLTVVSRPLALSCAVALVVALVGLWASGRTARYSAKKDPQFVVIDEVSGQHLTLLLGLGVPIWWKGASAAALSSMSVYLPGASLYFDAPNWKYLLVGFILFRVFDIWKPFPARQAESLPGGWGIMADDWIAGIYAGIGLWIARAAGL